MRRTQRLALARGLTTPEGATSAFCEAISRGQLDQACGCFVREGCLITPDATLVHGRDAIGAVLAQLIASSARVSIQVSAFVAAGEVALARERWRFESKAPAGQIFAQESSPTMVLRRIESDWKLAIAAPWGWGGVGAS
jgi:ketosteroid isomerase-like protein